MGRARLAPLALGVWVGLGGVRGMANEKKTAPGFHLGKDVRSVVVTRYAKLSDARDAPDKKRISVIRKSETVGRLVKLINSLPPTGTAMIKMGDVEWIRAEFYGHYDKPPVAVELYNGWVKSPDTSFYEGLPQEKEIYEILNQARPTPQKGLRVKSPVAVRVEEYDHAVYEVEQNPPNRAADISDPRVIKELVGWVNQLPLKGEMFVSFTPLVALTQAFFVEKDGTETALVFYNNGVSTTDGSFYAGSEIGEELQGKIFNVLRAALTRAAPSPRATFDIGDARSAFVELRATLSGPVTMANQITDSKVLSRVRAALAKLPTKGDVMKEWGEDTEVLTASFSRPGAPKLAINFYAGRIQTPTTGFYAAEKNPEASLYKILKEQLKEGK